MLVSPTMILHYPRTSAWIITNIPLVVFNARVRRAFMEYAELNLVQAYVALQHGSLPLIMYKEMPGSNGQFSGSRSPNTVFLAKAICERYENNAADRSDPRMHRLLESTILHEMVHWGDWKDGHDHPLEEGKEFEKAAYGADVNRYW